MYGLYYLTQYYNIHDKVHNTDIYVIYSNGLIESFKEEIRESDKLELKIFKYNDEIKDKLINKAIKRNNSYKRHDVEDVFHATVTLAYKDDFYGTYVPILTFVE